MKNITFILLFMVGSLYSCRTDEFDTDIIDGSPIIENYYESDVEGVILNEVGDPISGVKVSVNNSEQITDENGVFLFEDIIIPETGIIVTASKEAYFSTTKNIAVSESSTYKMVQGLSAYANEYSFNSKDGISVFLKDGGKIEVPENVLTLNGVLYNGQVKIYAKYIDTKNSENAKIQPANLKGKSITGEDVAIQSKGMIAVKLQTEDGTPLIIEQGSSINIKIPNNGGSQSNLLQAYILNESTGLWERKAEVENESGFFISEISETGWINFGEGHSGTELTLDVKQENNSPASGRNFLIHDGLNYLFNYSTSNGKLSCYVPQNTNLSIYTIGYCGEKISVDDLGSIDTDAKELNIVLPSFGSNGLNVTGELINCENETITSGYTLINNGSNIYFDHVDDQGMYNLSMVFCEDNPDKLTMVAKDNELLFTTVTSLELNGANAYKLDINGCNNAISFFNYNVINNGQLNIEGCIARQTKDELLITAVDVNGNNVILGVFGDAKGSFKANFFADGFSSASIGQTDVVIRTYEEVGGYIIGEFKNGGTEGNFVAKRIR